MVSNEKLREIVSEANEKVRADPEKRKRKEELIRELLTAPEDLHKRIVIGSDSVRTLK